MTYRGPFTLTTDEGTEFDVEGHYAVQGSPQGLRSWSGRFTGDAEVGRIAGETVTLRLPDGSEGKALVTNISMGSGYRGIRGEFAGTGPAPGEA